VTVQFPEQAVNKDGNDILAPLEGLQRDLGILPSDEDLAKSGASATFTGPPDSVAIIEAGATALSKWWSVVIAGLGGAAAITSAATKFWSGQTGGVRIALVIGTAGLLIAALIAISVMVAADVRGRAHGMAALYAARASVADQFLRQSLLANYPAPAHAQDNAPAQAVRAAADNAPNEGQAPGTPNQLLYQSIPLYLAASSAPALAVHKPTSQTGHLAGVRQLDDGTTDLLFVRQSDQQPSWYPSGDITVTEFTYLHAD
jgi:hypothetical protein